MSDVFKALSDPTRRRVLELLREAPRSAGELSDHFAVSRPTMSGHFAVLREAGLIASEKQGKSIVYHLQMSVLEEALLDFAGAFGWRLRTGKNSQGNQARRIQDMTADLRSLKPMAMIAIVGLAFLIAGVSVVVSRSFGLVDAPTAKRVVCIGLGVLLAAAGNSVPKMRFFEKRGYPALRAQPAQRFAGWVLALSGLAVVALWIFWSGTDTTFVSSTVALGGFALSGSVWAWLALGPRQEAAIPDDQAGGVQIVSAVRYALLCILASLFCVFAILLVDAVWGLSKWMVIAVALAIVFIGPFVIRKRAT